MLAKLTVRTIPGQALLLVCGVCGLHVLSTATGDSTATRLTFLLSLSLSRARALSLSLSLVAVGMLPYLHPSANSNARAKPADGGPSVNLADLMSDGCVTWGRGEKNQSRALSVVRPYPESPS